MFNRIGRIIRGWLLSTPVAKAWQVSSIHAALQKGRVQVHHIRPIGAASYIVQIDNSLSIDKVEKAWQPSLFQRVLSGDGQVALSDVRRTEFMRALNSDVGQDMTAMLNSGIMPPVDMEEDQQTARRSTAIQTVPNQLTYATLVSTLLRAAGLNVAECKELGDGGYDTRLFALSVV